MKALKCLLLVSALAPAGAVLAQQAQPARAPAQAGAAQPQQQQQQLTPEQQAQLARQNQDIGRAAAQVVQLVDQNKLTDVWQGVSPVAKGVVQQDAFVQQIAADRKRLGAVAERKQADITRVAYQAGGQVPAGNYINVVYATKFANTPQPVRELVSFHLDDDKVWRLSGYSLR